MAEPLSLFQRLQARRAAIGEGDPTGGEHVGSGKNTKPVRKETAPPKETSGQKSSEKMTPAEREKRIKKLQAEVDAKKAKRAASKK